MHQPFQTFSLMIFGCFNDGYDAYDDISRDVPATRDWLVNRSISRRCPAPTARDSPVVMAKPALLVVGVDTPIRQGSQLIRNHGWNGPARDRQPRTHACLLEKGIEAKTHVHVTVHT